MKIKKIIVDEKPRYCGDCRFCCQYYDEMHDEYFYQCVVTGKLIDDTEERPTVKSCDIFEEQEE